MYIKIFFNRQKDVQYNLAARHAEVNAITWETMTLVVRDFAETQLLGMLVI